MIRPGVQPDVITSQLVEKCMIPPKYELWLDGIYEKQEPRSSMERHPTVEEPAPLERVVAKKLTLIVPRPVWVSSFAQELDNDEELVELSYFRSQDNAVIRKWIPKADLMQRDKLAAMASAGLPVRSGTSSRLESFLEELIELNRRELPWMYIARRRGWHTITEHSTNETYTGYLAGNWIGPATAVSVTPDPRFSEMDEDGYSSKGLLETWIENFYQVAVKNDFSFFLSMSGFAPPLMKFLNQRTFIIHHWGHSGSGKTALARMAGSIWGDPEKTLGTFNSTDKAFTEVFATKTDTLVIFDELQMSKHSDHRTLIYELAAGTARARAKKDGGLQKKAKPWTAIVRMTGEEPLLKERDLGGQRNRVIEIRQDVLTDAEAKDIYLWTSKHYGSAGLEFLRRFIGPLNDDHGAKRAQFEHDLRARAAEFASEIRNTFPSIGQRADNFATIAVAARMAGGLIFAKHLGMTPNDAADMFWERAKESCLTVIGDLMKYESRDTLEVELTNAIRDHMSAYKTQWYDCVNQYDRERYIQRKGNFVSAGFFHYNGKNEIAIIPSAFQTIVKPFASEKQALLLLRDSGALITSVARPGSRTSSVRFKTTRTISDLGIKPASYYVFDYAKVFADAQLFDAEPACQMDPIE